MGSLFFAGVAQLVEQRFRKARVGGSIPLASFIRLRREINFQTLCKETSSPKGVYSAAP